VNFVSSNTVPSPSLVSTETLHEDLTDSEQLRSERVDTAPKGNRLGRIGRLSRCGEGSKSVVVLRVDDAGAARTRGRGSV